MNKHTKIAIGVIATIALVFIAYVYASPYLAVGKIRDAIEKRDAAALSEYVDYPAVKEDLRSQLNAIVAKKAKDDANNPFAAIGTLLVGALIDKVVDNLVSPDGIASLFAGDADLSKSEGIKSEKKDPFQSADVVKGYSGFSKFIVSVKDKGVADAVPIDFVLTRSGLSWKVSGIRFMDAVIATEKRQQEQEAIKTARLVKETILKAAVATSAPDNAGHINQDWSILDQLFPGITWRDGQSRDFAFVKTANLSDDIIVRFYGARAMVMASEVIFSMRADSPQKVLAEIASNPDFSATQCDSDEGSTEVTRFYRFKTKGVQPVIAIYQYSVGNASGSESLIFGQDLNVPPLGSDAERGKWVNTCK